MPSPRHAPIPPPLLTASEVAHLARISDTKFRQLVRNGSGPQSVRIDTLVRYPSENVYAWIKALPCITKED